jgi:DNA mismatch repair protein MutL
VHSYPTFLFERGVEPHEFLMPLFEKIEAEGLPPGREEALHEVLDMMACKAAIKAGDRLSETEIRDLLKFRETVERSSNCPHGRPTSIRLTIRELEKRFGRS